MITRFLIGIWRLLSLLPMPLVHLFGRLIGKLFSLIPNRDRRITDINLQICFPGLSDNERMKLRNRILEQSGCTIAEMGIIWFRSTEQVLSLVKAVSGEELLQREPGQGLILLVPHLGCWEIVGLYVSRFEKLTTLYRPPRVQSLERIIKHARERNGSELVPTDASGVKRLYQILREGNISGILPDQQPGSNKGAAFAPFFGRPALTMLLVNRLMKKTKAKAVFCYAERLPKGDGFHLHFQAAPEGLDDSDPVVAAAALNQGVESCVRRLPEQYQWSYKRFRRQPEGCPNPYRKIS